MFRHPGVAGEYQTEAAAMYWVAIEEFNLSYYIGVTRLFTVYIYIHTFTHCGNLIWGSRVLQESATQVCKVCGEERSRDGEPAC